VAGKLVDLVTVGKVRCTDGGKENTPYNANSDVCHKVHVDEKIQHIKAIHLHYPKLIFEIWLKQTDGEKNVRNLIKTPMFEKRQNTHFRNQN
jgi:hypothetical protein